LELLFNAFLNLPFRDQPATSLEINTDSDLGPVSRSSSYSTYLCLFSFVTGRFRPLGIKSMVCRSPNFSSSTEKVNSTIPSMSFSL
jgi:hypothetical protein